jgi:hypothetical protein
MGLYTIINIPEEVAMPAQEFNCPNCGAPIDYQGQDTSTVRCPFCSTSVIIPAELRPKPGPHITHTPAYPPPAARSKGGLLLGIIATAIFLVIGGVIAVSILLTNQASQASSSLLNPSAELLTQIPMQPPTRVATSTPRRPSLTPTPSFAQFKGTFGSQGIGLGLLNDARYLAIDGSGTVYVADYQGGRIQAFDPDGKFLHMWQVGDKNTIIAGMAANHQGVVWVAFEGDIYRYDGASGKLLEKVSYANGPEFGDLAALPDGGMIGVWYEGRWGLITSLEGHRDDLAWFDPDGGTVRTLQGFISGQTESLALDTLVAVDGQGTIYALSEGEIFKFTAQGKFVTRFPAQGDPNGGSFSVGALAVDGQGRIFTASSKVISIFSPDGRLLKSFPVDFFADRIAINEAGELYLLARDKVARYTLANLP